MRQSVGELPAEHAWQNRDGGLTVITAAIVLLNTAYLGCVIDHLRARGEPLEVMATATP